MILFREIPATRERVYRADEAPDSVKEKALARVAEWVDASDISESVFGTCPETGLRYDEAARGVRLETTGRDAPTWAIYSKGAGVGLVGSVDDVDRFLAFLESEGKLTRHDVRRLRYVEREGGISLRFGKRRSYGEGTVSEFDAGPVEFDSDEIEQALDTLRDEWESYVEALEQRALSALEKEHDYLTSWEYFAERLRDFDEGLDDEGRTVSLSECIETDEGEE